jgi:hypothetical protein
MTTPLPLYADISAEPYVSMISGNDITAAVVAAIAAVDGVATGGVVLLPRGNWICGFVALPSGAIIRGEDRTLTTLTLKPGVTGGVMFGVNNASDVTLSGFTAASSLASNPTNLGAIRLEGSSSRVVIDGMGFVGWVGVNAGSPQGAGISLAGTGSSASISNCIFYQCFDGISTYGFTDGVVENCTFNACQRFGGVVGSGSHRWRIVNNQGDGNSTLYAGAGFAAIASNDVLFDQNRFWGSLLGHGMQFNGCLRTQATNGNHQYNAISGQDFYQSPNGKSANNVLDNNTIRGLEIDSGSNGHQSVNDSGTGNGDVDLSTFRSANVEVISFTGNVRAWDAATAHTATVANGGSGYAVGEVLTATGGRFLTAFQATVSAVSGGAVTAVTIADATDGDYWELPANPVVMSGSGTGCALNVLWDGQGSNTSAKATIVGGGTGSTLLIAASASSGVRLSSWRGAVSDPGRAIVSAEACDQYTVPLTPLTLSAGWIAFDPTWQAPAYFKDAEGWVRLVGTMKNGTTTAGTVIGVLPAGYRPSLVAGPWQVFGLNGTVSLFIDNSGQVVAQSALNASRTALDGIAFKSA